jgi:hypothetical protein
MRIKIGINSCHDYGRFMEQVPLGKISLFGYTWNIVELHCEPPFTISARLMCDDVKFGDVS